MPKSTGNEWFGAPAAAQHVGLYLTTLYKLIDEGDLPAYKIGRVRIRIRRVDLDDSLDRSRIQPGDLVHLYGPDSDEPGGDDDRVEE